MCNDKKYNGWTNYETWVTKLWIDNNESLYNQYRDAAKEISDNSEVDSIFSADERALYDFEQYLKEDLEAMNPCTDSGLFTYLMNSAISEINFMEIAKSIMEDIEG